jgi:SAM-dependent methyltransferase
VRSHLVTAGPGADERERLPDGVTLIAGSVCFQTTPSSAPRVLPVADLRFEVPRLAEIYDSLDSDRSDLDVYSDLVDELGAQTILDIGCGTGTFACLLSRRGKDVIGVDPAAASLNVARRKPGADQVRWLQGDVSALPPLQVDLAIMTGNVAQVFLTDHEWVASLRLLSESLGPGGRFVFESRDPGARAWLDWNPQDSYSRTFIPAVGAVQTWVEVVDVQDGLVSFRSTFVFDADGTELTSDSTLRFRSQSELIDSLEAVNLAPQDVRDARDRPGKELVFIARRID